MKRLFKTPFRRAALRRLPTTPFRSRILRVFLQHYTGAPPARFLSVISEQRSRIYYKAKASKSARAHSQATPQEGHTHIFSPEPSTAIKRAHVPSHKKAGARRVKNKQKMKKSTSISPRPTEKPQQSAIAPASDNKKTCTTFVCDVQLTPKYVKSGHGRNSVA